MQKEDFVIGLEYMGSILEKGPLMPFYNAIHIKGDTLYANNGVIGIKVFLGEDTKLDCYVPGIPVANLIGSLRVDEFDMEVKDNKFRVMTDKLEGSFGLCDFDENDIPAWVGGGESKEDTKEGQKGSAFVPLPDNFLIGLDVSKFCGDDRLNGALAGVCVDKGGIMVTDLRRAIRFKCESVFDRFFVLPLAFVKLVKPSEEKVSGVLSDGTFVLKVGNVEIETSLLSGKYPVEQFDGFFASVDEHSYYKFTDEWVDAVKRHSTYARSDDTMFDVLRVICDAKKGCQLITEGEQGRVVEKVDLKMGGDGDRVDFNINPFFLIKVLKYFDGFAYDSKASTVRFSSGEMDFIAKTITK